MPHDWQLNGHFDPAKLRPLYEAMACRESCRSFLGAPSAEQWTALGALAEAFALPGVRIAVCHGVLAAGSTPLQYSLSGDGLIACLTR